MNSEIVIKSLGLAECTHDLLADFVRYQEVRRAWRRVSGEWVLRDVIYNDDWDETERQQKITSLRRCIEQGGYVIGAYTGSKLVGFASVIAQLFGSTNQYAEMKFLHVSREYRGNGIGRRLFFEITGLAKRIGARKLYISAHSAEDSMAFYRKVGCIDAQEPNRTLEENEPFDCQLEFELGKIG